MMIRSMACCVAVLSLTAGILSADVYRTPLPGVTVGATCGPNCNSCNTGGSMLPPGAMMPSGVCQSCPPGFGQQCPIPGGMVVDGSCPTCPTMNACEWCPSSCPTMCPSMGMCDSCLPGCNMSWCIKTKICCRDNPCQMPPHYPYSPACHGHYYFAPYNYQTALRHKEYARCQNLDYRFPYAAPTFEHAYNEIIGNREMLLAGEDLVEPAEGLPNLEDILNRN